MNFMQNKKLSYLAKIFVIIIALSNTVCTQTKTNIVSELNPTIAQKEVKVTYIANEGVLIASKDKQVLIDGLHREYKPAFSYPPDDLRKLLENALSPYDQIDLLLVSHIHLDHFHPRSIGLHLKNNPKSVLVTTNQVADEVKKNYEDHAKINPQIKSISHVWKKTVQMNFDGIKVKVLGLEHTNKQFKSIKNFGYLVEIGGRKFLHVGDAKMTAENFSAFKLHDEKIDVAFLPLWFLISKAGRDLVKKQINPKNIVAVHISPNVAERAKTELKKHYPDITVFTKILETKAF